MLNVHLRVIDAGTKQPTACRLRISDAADREYPPLGCVGEFALGRNEDVNGHVFTSGRRYYSISGMCEIPLPGGVPLTIELSKGPEFLPELHEITLGAGQMALRYTLQRWHDSRLDGWYSGDIRCHSLTPHAAMQEAMAEDLAIVQLLAKETRFLSSNGRNCVSVPNIESYSGQQPCLERSGHLVGVGTLNTHPVLGSLALLYSHRAVFPLSFGAPDATDDWSLADWCDQCHRKKGLVVWADPFRFDNNLAPEAFADLVSGRIDAVECTPAGPSLVEVYRAWSAGLVFPIVGGSGKDSNRTALGAMRTYAHVNAVEPLTLSSWIQSVWIEAIRQRYTYVSSGPLVALTVDQQPVGSILERTPGKNAWIKADIASIQPMRPLEIVVNGVAVMRVASADTAPPYRASLEFEHPITDPCWIAARCTGPQFAHTTPVWIKVDGRLPTDPNAVCTFDRLLSATLDWVQNVGRFEIPRRKEQLRAVFEQARQTLMATR